MIVCLTLLILHSYFSSTCVYQHYDFSPVHDFYIILYLSHSSYILFYFKYVIVGYGARHVHTLIHASYYTLTPSCTVSGSHTLKRLPSGRVGPKTHTLECETCILCVS